jgi:hypothetical protein
VRRSFSSARRHSLAGASLLPRQIPSPRLTCYQKARTFPPNVDVRARFEQGITDKCCEKTSRVTVVYDSPRRFCVTPSRDASARRLFSVMGLSGVEPLTSRLSALNDDGNVDRSLTNPAPINAYVHPKTPPLLPGPLPGANVAATRNKTRAFNFHAGLGPILRDCWVEALETLAKS